MRRLLDSARKTWQDTRMDTEDDATITFRLPNRMKLLLNLEASAEERTLSAHIRMLIAEARSVRVTTYRKRRGEAK